MNRGSNVDTPGRPISFRKLKDARHIMTMTLGLVEEQSPMQISLTINARTVNEDARQKNCCASQVIVYGIDLRVSGSVSVSPSFRLKNVFHLDFYI